jgi:hypothetical protein
MFKTNEQWQEDLSHVVRQIDHLKSLNGNIPDDTVKATLLSWEKYKRNVESTMNQSIIKKMPTNIIGQTEIEYLLERLVLEAQRLNDKVVQFEKEHNLETGIVVRFVRQPEMMT